MKYGVFVNTCSSRYRRIVNTFNMGDSYVSFSIKSILNDIGIIDDDIIKIAFEDAGNVNEECRVIASGHFRKQYNFDFINQNKVDPIYLGYSITDLCLAKEEIDHYKCHEPILCRDELTRNALRSYGIEAYLYGCPTLLLPHRNNIVVDPFVYAVDLNNKTIDKLKKSTHGVIQCSQMIKMHYPSDDEMQRCEKKH